MLTVAVLGVPIEYVDLGCIDTMTVSVSSNSVSWIGVMTTSAND
jgi:hypothetical protein